LFGPEKEISRSLYFHHKIYNSIIEIEYLTM
jgi:hypothetical protein